MKKLVIFLTVSTTFLFAGMAERIEKLENEMREIGVTNTMDTYGANLRAGQPEVEGEGNDWYLTGELLYWDAKAGGTEYAFTSGLPTTLPNPPIRGSIKSNSFGWAMGGRIGVGVIIPHDSWDFYLNFTFYRNHDSTGTRKSPPAFLVSQVGFFGGAFENAKSTYDLTYLNFDFEIGKKYFLSQRLSLRPYFGLKGTRLFQEHKVKLLFSPLQMEGQLVREFYRIYNRCDSNGLGPRIGIQGEWFLGYGFRFENEIAGALLYTYFDVVDKEKTSPGTSPINCNIRMGGKVRRFIPFVQIFSGLTWGDYLIKESYYLTLKFGYEVLYFWRENQCINPDNWDAGQGGPNIRLNYKRFAEDLSFYGITFKARLDF